MVQFIVVAFASWVLGLILRSGEDPNSARVQHSGRGSDFFLLPFTVVSVYRQQVKDNDLRHWYEKIATIAFMVGFWMFLVFMAGVLWDAAAQWGACPSGQHLQGGQGGGEQFCE